MDHVKLKNCRHLGLKSPGMSQFEKEEFFSRDFNSNKLHLHRRRGHFKNFQPEKNQADIFQLKFLRIIKFLRIMKRHLW